jgi:hypothetical protein
MFGRYSSPNIPATRFKGMAKFRSMSPARAIEGAARCGGDSSENEKNTMIKVFYLLWYFFLLLQIQKWLQ